MRRAAPWRIRDLARQLQAFQGPQGARLGPAGLPLLGDQGAPPDQRQRKQALFLDLEALGEGPALQPCPLSGQRLCRPLTSTWSPLPLMTARHCLGR